MTDTPKGTSTEVAPATCKARLSARDVSVLVLHGPGLGAHEPAFYQVVAHEDGEDGDRGQIRRDGIGLYSDEGLSGAPPGTRATGAS